MTHEGSCDDGPVTLATPPIAAVVRACVTTSASMRFACKRLKLRRCFVLSLERGGGGGGKE